MFRKAALSAFAVLVAVGCGGSGGSSPSTGSGEFLVVNRDGDFYTIKPEGTGLRPISTLKGNFGAVSPDGSLLAYTTTGSVNPNQLWVANTDGSVDRKLIDVEGETSMSFFPGGQEVAYFESEGEGDSATIWIRAVNVDTGAKRTVVQVPRDMSYGGGLSINASGTTAAMVARSGNDSVMHVMLVSLADGTTTDLGRGAYPRFSQDGLRLAYVTEGKDLAIRDLGEQKTTVTDLAEEVQNVAFSPRGDTVYLGLRSDDAAGANQPKVAKLLIGSETPQVLPQQEKAGFFLVASIGPG